MSKYVQINIGRNIKGEPMPQQAWDNFRDTATEALLASCRTVAPEIWVHNSSFAEDEESVHLSTVADVDTYALRVSLHRLAHLYFQESIALIVGSDLIKG